jgi:hypothetical protein
VLKLDNVTFDCDDPARISAFWAAALGYQREVIDGSIAIVTAPDGTPPKLLFIKVPEPRTVKNRVHVDLRSDDREAEIERLIGLGATRGATHAEYGVTWTVLQDPEGNELCVGQHDSE